MAKTKTIFVFPNPYGLLDKNGMLAGMCPEAEGRRAPGAIPSQRKIGAVLKMVPGSYDNSEAAGRAPGGPLQSRAEYVCEFTATQPIPVIVDAETEGYYVSRVRSKDIFLCKDAEDVPVHALAAARAKAVLDYVAAYGAPPPVEKWKGQFAIDELIAELSKALIAKAEEDAKEAAIKLEAAKAEADKVKVDPLEKARAAIAKLSNPEASKGAVAKAADANLKTSKEK